MRYDICKDGVEGFTKGLNIINAINMSVSFVLWALFPLGTWREMRHHKKIVVTDVGVCRVRTVSKYRARLRCLGESCTREKTVVVLMDQLFIIHLLKGQIAFILDLSSFSNFFKMHIFCGAGIAYCFVLPRHILIAEYEMLSERSYRILVLYDLANGSIEINHARMNAQ